MFKLYDYRVILNSYLRMKHNNIMAVNCRIVYIYPQVKYQLNLGKLSNNSSVIITYYLTF